jgi:SAM-dependent methyltransferase
MARAHDRERDRKQARRVVAESYSCQPSGATAPMLSHGTLDLRSMPQETTDGDVVSTPFKGESVPFGVYADFYDALYRDKDYQAECDYLADTFERLETRPTLTILDLGCGTGNHDLPLTSMRYRVVGVDRSEEMVAQARRKSRSAELGAEFLIGDVRDFDLRREFDAVISMFAVMCYQRTNQDLLGMMRTARRHLRHGGLFIFDGWFGPAVLMDRPVENSKIVQGENGETIERHASPVLDVVRQTVEVRYRVTRSRDGAVIDDATESHHMRFLFAQEIALMLEMADFDLIEIGPFMRLGEVLSSESWNFSAVARAR